MKYNFRVLALQSGKKTLFAQPLHPEMHHLTTILTSLGSISELSWFKKELIKAREEGGGTGLDTLICRIEGVDCYVSQTYDDTVEPTKYSLQQVYDFIDEAIEFINHYNNGSIPGVIPESRMEELFIVPKEHIKDSFWKES